MGDDSPILASDAEREQSIVLLRDAVTSGRLTLEEFSERVGQGGPFASQVLEPLAWLPPEGAPRLRIRA